MPSPGWEVGEASDPGQASAPLRQRLAAQEIELQIAQATIEVKREQIDEARCSALGTQARLLATVDALTEAAQLRERNASELRELLEEAECPICLERPADTVLLPCGHVCCCHTECPSSEVQSCPVCSGAVTGRARLYGAITLLGELMMRRQHGQENTPSCTDVSDLPRLQAGHAADVMQQLQGMQTRIRTTIKEKDAELEKITSRCAQEADAIKGQLKARDAHFAREREHHQAQVAALQAKVEALEQQVRAEKDRAETLAMRAELEGLRHSVSRMKAQLEEHWAQKQMQEARMTEERRRWHAQGQEQRVQIEEAEKRSKWHEARAAEERSRYEAQIEEAEKRNRSQEAQAAEERNRFVLCWQTQNAQLETVRRKLDAQREQAEERDRVWKDKERTCERMRAQHEAEVALLQGRRDALQQQFDNQQLELCGTQTELRHLHAEAETQKAQLQTVKRELDAQREQAEEQERVWKDKERDWERSRAEHEAAQEALRARRRDAAAQWVEERRRRSLLASASGTEATEDPRTKDTRTEDPRTEGTADAAARADVNAAFQVMDVVGGVGIVGRCRPCGVCGPCRRR